MNPRISVLQDEYETLKRSLDAFDATAASEHRDLNEDETVEYDGALKRMDVIETSLAKLDKQDARFAAVAETTQRVSPRAARTNPRTIVLPTMGEQLLIRGRHALGKDSNVDGTDYETLVRSFEDETLQRVVAHGVQSDGLSPTTIEGDLVKFVDASRNAVASSRRLPMPDNKSNTFKRPRLSTVTSAALQSAEGDVLSSTRAALTGDTVTKHTYGGVVSFSEQEIDWTDPAMLAVTLQDLAEQYGIVTDDVLCTAIETASTASDATTLALDAASDAVIAAVAAASAIAYGTSKKMPDVLYAAPDRFFYLASLVDGDGRPVFPVAGGTIVNSAGSNAPGVTSWGSMNVLGLRVVVDPNFTSNFLAVAVSQLVESYEQNKGLLSIAAPSTLEVQYAYRGYFATNVYSQGFGALEAS